MPERNVPLPLRDRAEAGALLAERLRGYADRSDVIVLALPRGGVPVGFVIAERLHVELDVVVVRKLGVPFHDELAMGAVASGGLRVLNRDVVRLARVDEATIDRVAGEQMEEIARREARYRDGAPAPPLRGRMVILVDDGLATGSTMTVAVQAVRREHPRRIIVAVPVAATESCTELAGYVDEMICLYTPEPFRAVSLWYETFDQTSDDAVIELLRRAHEHHAALDRQ
ncbi:MAG TPA: phosphoribosyltransferase [Casimicrobiaceae bacterium]|jgi:putative phosphoribosyl transferase